MTDITTLEQTAVEERAATLLIDGEWRESISRQVFPSINPATGEVVGYVSAGTQHDVDAAVRAARAALTERRWLSLPPPRRARILFAIADGIEAAVDELATNETRENGMPVTMARMMVSGCAEIFRYFGGWVTKIHGLTSDIAAGDAFHCYTRKDPVGVAALIVPWNGPMIQACRKVAPALAAGCTAVLKPAEDTSLNTLHLARIFMEAGVPPGVLNIVTGLGHVVGQALAEHEDIDKVSFTGSTATGRRIVQAAAGNFKRVTLELGGKSPVIVLDDADLEMAVPSILRGIMGNAGQACVAGSRLYVQRGIHDRLLDALSGAASKMVIGNGLDENTHMGPVISQKQLDRILGYIESGVSDGATLLTGGKRRGDTGFFIEPTILAEAPASSKLMREEIFGPVLAATRFDDVDEAIRQANDTRYGLAAAVYTNSLGKAHGIAKAIEAGYVWINTHHVMDFSLPFGGYKESGWGREDGAQGIEGYLETKTVVARLY